MLLRAAGLDFVRIDMEHSPFSMETVADMAALARAMNFPMVVRPPEGNREWITRLLDAGVWNLHVPQADTPRISACSARRVRPRPSTSTAAIWWRRRASTARRWRCASVVDEIRRTVPRS